MHEIPDSLKLTALTTATPLVILQRTHPAYVYVLSEQMVKSCGQNFVFHTLFLGLLVYELDFIFSKKNNVDEENQNYFIHLS